MVPHQDTARSKKFSRRSIPPVRAAVATLVLIATAVLGISSAALASSADAHEIGDTAIVSHTCRHHDGCADSAIVSHTCRHHDGCADTGALTFHTCRHHDGCHATDQAAGVARHQCVDAVATAGTANLVETLDPRHGGCHDHELEPAL